MDKKAFVKKNMVFFKYEDFNIHQILNFLRFLHAVYFTFDKYVSVIHNVFEISGIIKCHYSYNNVNMLHKFC